jgi:hypothetical protein
MKKPASKIRADIAKLQEQLKVAETREAERIGRLALKAGLGEIEIDDGKLVVAFEEIAKRFRGGGNQERKITSAPDTTGAASGQSSEA